MEGAETETATETLDTETETTENIRVVTIPEGKGAGDLLLFTDLHTGAAALSLSLSLSVSISPSRARGLYGFIAELGTAASGLEYNVTVPEGYSEGDELEVQLEADTEEHTETLAERHTGTHGGLTLSPSRPPQAEKDSARGSEPPGTPERSPAEEATPPSPVGEGGCVRETETAREGGVLHLSPKRPPTRPPPARPSPT